MLHAPATFGPRNRMKSSREMPAHERWALDQPLESGGWARRDRPALPARRANGTFEGNRLHLGKATMLARSFCNQQTHGLHSPEWHCFLTLSVTRGADGRDACASTRRDRPNRRLHAVVRPRSYAPPWTINRTHLLVSKSYSTRRYQSPPSSTTTGRHLHCGNGSECLNRLINTRRVSPNAIPTY